MADSIEGRRVLITGGSSGVGAALGAAMGAAGAQVALLARASNRLTATAGRIPGAAALPADVREPAQVEAAVSEAAERLGGLDIVVNAVGVNRAARFSDAALADLRDMIDTNLLGPMVAVRAALPHLRLSAAADVVNVSSMSARRTLAVESGVYAATKAALTTWTTTLSQELGPDRIRVMLISPGIIDTPFADQTVDPQQRSTRRRLSAEIGLTAAEVADEIVHMLSRPRRIRLHDVAVLPAAQRT